jgi:hypothetical protein
MNSQCNLWIILCVSILVAIFELAQAQNFYSSRYDNINVDTIFNSNRLLNNYVDCLLDKKACPPEGKDLKRKENFKLFFKYRNRFNGQIKFKIVYLTPLFQFIKKKKSCSEI